jgi:hypothetical protein
VRRRFFEKDLLSVFAARAKCDVLPGPRPNTIVPRKIASGRSVPNTIQRLSQHAPDSVGRRLSEVPVRARLVAGGSERAVRPMDLELEG